MKDKCEALGRSQRVEHNQKSRAQHVGEDRLFVGTGTLWLGLLVLERLLRSGPARAQHPQAHPSQHRGEPPSQVLDTLGVRSIQPDPGLLHGVLGLGQGSEHPVGHRLEPRPAGHELGRQVGFHLTPLTRRLARM